jgi:hypothetical protein
MTLRIQVPVAGAILGADGRKKVFAAGTAQPLAQVVCRAFPTRLRLLLQLWRSLSATRKTQLRGRKPRRPYHRSGFLG